MTTRAAWLPIMSAVAAVGCGGDEQISREVIYRASALTSAEPGGRLYTTSRQTRNDRGGAFAVNRVLASF